MLRVVRETIENYMLLTPGDKVIVAVSGGPDSVALAHLLLVLKTHYRIELHIAHLNHMFRGPEAERDARAVTDLARDFGLPCTVSNVDVPAFAASRRMSAQAAARKVRYDFLEQVRVSQQATKIATGHHADDQAETLLMNILRGAGPEGLSGIPPKRDGVFIRPLIDATREEIETYCRENRLPFQHDSSNFKPVYLRNKVRLELLPQLEKEYNPGIRLSLTRLSHIMREENEFMDAQVRDFWRRLVISETGTEVIFNLPGFLAAPPALQRRMLRKAWAAIRGAERDLAFIHLEQAVNFLRRGITGGVIEFPRHILLVKGYDNFRLTVTGGEPEKADFHQPLTVPGITGIPELGMSIEARLTENCPGFDPVNQKEVWLDYDKLPGSLEVRSRQPGDRFWPLGGSGSKKLKDFLIDEKIPRALRDKIPIVVTGEAIVWVCGLRSDHRWRVTDETRTFLRLKIVENITEQN